MASGLSPPDSAVLRALFPGDGESAARMRSIDWTQTPLGPIAGWPQSLRTLVPILLTSPCAMCVIWGPELIFLHNDSYRPILGAAKAASALGSRSQDAFREVWSLVGPRFQRVMAGEALALVDTLIPLDRNGAIEECFFTLADSPLLDDAGQVAGILAIVQETTPRVISVRRLATLRELAATGTLAESPGAAFVGALAALAKNSADIPFSALYGIEPDGQVLLRGETGMAAFSEAARAALERPANGRGWPFSQSAGRPGLLVVEDLRARFGELISSAAPEPLERAILAPLRRPGSGALLGYFAAGVNPRCVFDDAYRGFFDLLSAQVGRDLAQAAVRQEHHLLLAREEAAREDAERASQAKDEFLALVSHELRNPLSAMLGWTRLLRGGRLTEPRREHALETIERNAMNQSQLIEDLLDLSRIVSGKLRLEARLVRVVDVVRAALDSVRLALEAKQIRLEAPVDDAALSMVGDPRRLLQIVWTLLSNAAKFTPQGGSIRVVVKREEEAIELAVIDSGSGISPDYLPHVFGRFQSADASSTRAHGGLGLGLSLAKGLVELHGGTIRAQSAGEGKGSTFVARFPVAPLRDTRAPDDPPEGGFRRQPQLSGLNLLVVDDETDGREVVAEFLEQCGARVLRAASAQEALALFESDRPDVILSDLRMRGEDGLSLIQKIRGLPVESGGGTPAASLTACSGVEDRQRALAMGFNIHLEKPVEPAELVAAIARLGRLSTERSAGR